MKRPPSILSWRIERRRFCRDTVLLIAVLATRRGVASAEASKRDVSALADASYIYVATVRKDGSQSRAVPVWFISTPQGEVLLDTSAESWKAKRIRRGSPALVWIGSRGGPAFIGTAEIVTERAVQDAMIEEIPKKYFLARIGLFGPKRAKFDAGQIVTIRIVPERDLAEGFQSRPGAPAPTLRETTRS